MALTLDTMKEWERQLVVGSGGPAVLEHAAYQELKRACGKFPKFPDRLLLPEKMPCALGEQLAAARECNDAEGGAHASGYSVFCEEFLEMCEAEQAGDLEAARKELAQAMAMLLRIGIHLPHYCEEARKAKEAGHGG